MQEKKGWKNEVGLLSWTSFLFATIFGFLHLLHFTTVWDDAFISFRAVENWIQFGLPVYNLDVIEWVPTTFLWVTLLGLFNKIITIPLPLLAQWLGGLSGIGILVFFFLTRIQDENLWQRNIAAMLCVFSSLWAAWPLSGMETTFCSLLLTGAVLLFDRYIYEEQPFDLYSSAVLIALASLTRWEASLIIGVMLGFLVLMKKWRPGVIYLTIVGVVLLPACLFLYNVFGSVLPSSFYAKVHGFENWHHGKFYVKNIIKQFWLLMLVPFLPALLIGKNSKQKLSVLFLVAIIFVWLIYVMVIGGDFMPYQRFVAPIWPIIAILAGRAIVQTTSWLLTRWNNQRKIILITISVLTGFILFRQAIPTWRSVDRQMVNEWTKEETHRKYIGQWLASEKQNNAFSIAVRPAGIIPFYSKLKAYDLYALTNRKAAHSATFVKEYWVGHQMVNVNWVMDQEPDIVILDEHLYGKNEIPQKIGDGVIEKQWLNNEKEKLFKGKLAEIRPGLWLKYYEKSK